MVLRTVRELLGVKSEEHPVGFKKFVLFAFRGFRVRLHVWADGSGNDSRHDHRWWFVSMPLLGRFQETLYEPTEGKSFLRIEVDDFNDERDGVRRYRRAGDSGLKIKREVVRRPLVPYYCRRGQVHSLVPVGRGVHASIVLTGPLERGTSYIYRAPDKLDVELTD